MRTGKETQAPGSILQEKSLYVELMEFINNRTIFKAYFNQSVTKQDPMEPSLDRPPPPRPLLKFLSEVPR